MLIILLSLYIYLFAINIVNYLLILLLFNDTSIIIIINHQILLVLLLNYMLYI